MPRPVRSLHAGAVHIAAALGRANGGAPAPAGVYFVTLRAGARDIGTQKLVMLR